MDPYEITFQTYHKIAKLYQDKFMDMSLYDESYNRICELVENKNAKILEVGCGPGNITKYLLKNRPDFEILGVDMAEGMIELAKLNNPTARFELMDARSIEKITHKFDAIVIGFCVPYLSKEDCRKLIHDCSNLLNDKGLLYFSLVEGDYLKSGWETNNKGIDSVYFYYHELEYLQMYLEKYNFENVELMYVDYTQNTKKESKHLIIISNKK